MAVNSRIEQVVELQCVAIADEKRPTTVPAALAQPRARPRWNARRRANAARATAALSQVAVAVRRAAVYHAAVAEVHVVVVVAQLAVVARAVAADDNI